MMNWDTSGIQRKRNNLANEKVSWACEWNENWMKIEEVNERQGCLEEMNKKQSFLEEMNEKINS